MERLKNWIDGLRFDFVGSRWLFSNASAALVVLSWIAFAAVGPNWGIDFTGGTEIRVAFEQPMEIGELRSKLSGIGLGDDAVQSSGVNEYTIRIQDTAFGTEEVRTELRKAYDAAFGPDWVVDLTMDSEVGARAVTRHNGNPVTADAVEKAVAHLPWAKFTPTRMESTVVIQVAGLTEFVERAIQSSVGEDVRFDVRSVESVGPRVGADLRRDGFVALLATLGLVLVYIAFRFDLVYAPGAVLSLIHDVSLTTGVFVLFQLEFSVAMVGALLTLVGYSLNDTIVVYDRIRENRGKYRRRDLAELINVSINETLTRTIATNGATMLAITPMIFMGGEAIQNFALAMFCGIVFGTYSTIYVASPMILIFEDLRPALGRWIRLPELAGGAPDVVAPEVVDETLTESERRRRERQEAARRLSQTD